MNSNVLDIASDIELSYYVLKKEFGLPDRVVYLHCAQGFRLVVLQCRLLLLRKTDRFEGVFKKKMFYMLHVFFFL